MHTLIALIPVLPLIGFTINIFFGKRLRGASAYLAIGALAMSFALSVALFLRIADDPTPITVSLFSWIPTGDLQIPIAFLVDRLTAVYLLVVTGVGSLIHVYSVGYMHGDDRYSRFFAYLNLFAAMMLILVLDRSTCGSSRRALPTFTAISNPWRYCTSEIVSDHISGGMRTGSGSLKLSFAFRW